VSWKLIQLQRVVRKDTEKLVSDQKSCSGALHPDAAKRLLNLADTCRLETCRGTVLPVVASAGESMSDFRTRWFAFHHRHIEPVSKEIFSHVEKMVIGTLIISAGAHVSSNEPSIVLFGYLRHGLVGRGVELFGIALLLLNFIDGFYKLAKLEWHVAFQIAMSLCYIILSVRLVQLILAFRGE
jgi:hypothetical protein